MAKIASTYPAPAWALARRRAAATAPAPNTDGGNSVASAVLGRRLAREHIRQWYGGGLTGGFPRTTIGGYGGRDSGNSAELHRLYEEMAYREGMLKAPLQRSADSVASQTLQVIPADKKSPRDREVAEALREALLDAPGGLGHGPTGLPAIVDELVLPARVCGFNVVEAPFKDRPEDRGKLRGKLGIRKFAAKRAGTYRLRYSEFGEITGVRPASGAGAAGDDAWIDPGEFIIYPYLALYGLTHSELWAAQRGYDFKESCYRLRLFFLDKLSGGSLWVNGVQADRFETMKAALAEFRSCGFIVLEANEELHALDLAMGADSEFDAAMQYADRDMLIAADGGHLHIQEGKNAGNHGDSQQQSETGPELKDWRFAAAVASLLTVYGRRWVDVNFRGADYPRVKIGDIDPAATRADADLADAVKKLGYELDPEEVEERLGWKVMGKAAPAPAFGGPPRPGQPGGEGPQDGGGAQDQWAWEEVPAGDRGQQQQGAWR